MALASGPVSGSPLDGLTPTHPRVLVRGDDFARVEQLVATDPLAAQWFADLRERAQALLDEPVAVYELGDGVRLLSVSREVLDRSQTLSLMHRLDPDPRYLDRLWAEMEAVAAFPHWNPDHFLDVGEMALGVAIAYDWLHDAWTDEQRAVIRGALLEHGLRPGLDAYERGAWWTQADMNWNQVCNGGLIAAALAVADDEPGLAAPMIELAVASLRLPMQRYVPQGGYDEGPGYWDYGTSYNVYALAALESALGHDFGLGDTEGFDRTGDFVFHLTGPTGRVFNFADATTGRVRTPVFWYLARRYDRPAYARYAADHNRGSALDLLWYDPALLHPPDAALPLGANYLGAGVATLRTGWDDPDALFVGVKGGDNGKPHGQHDLGSFILEADGVRWFIDPGRDDYNLPGYFDAGERGRRWTYYRNRAEGHNTVVLDPAAGDGPDQRWHAVAPVLLEGRTATVDLSEACGRPLTRRITLDPQARTVTVTDTLGGDGPADFWWFAHTRARITLSADGRTATLRQRGKAFTARILEPADARFSIMDARPLPGSPDPAGQNPNNGAPLENRSEVNAFVRRGETPRYGEPDPANAIRKLAVYRQAHRPFTTIIVLGPTVRPLSEPQK